MQNQAKLVRTAQISKHRNDAKSAAEHLAPHMENQLQWLGLDSGRPSGSYRDQTLGLRSVVPLQSALIAKEPRCEAYLSNKITVLFTSVQAGHLFATS
jgi:hypothetical protein